jgi:trigger factor
VKNVKERVLPELDDAWVADATEFESVAELIEDTRTRLAETRTDQTRNAVRVNLGVELAKLVDIDPPESMVTGEMQARLQSLAYRLQASGMRIEDYLQITGRDPEAFAGELREAAVEAVKVDLALRAIATAQDIGVSDDELEHEIIHLIGDDDMTVEEAIEELRSGGQLSAVRSEVLKRNALEWLVAATQFVDPDGNPVPGELIELPAHDHDHGDHDDHQHDDHDHDTEDAE